MAGVIIEVAVEERAGEDAEQDDARRPALAAAGSRLAVDQGEQGEAAALALVVGAHDDGDIFERHHDHHRPEDQAEHAEDLGASRRRQLVMAGEGLAEGVDRAGADVAEDDADRADGKLRRCPMRMVRPAGRSAGELGWRGYRSSVRNETSAFLFAAPAPPERRAA